MSVIRSPIHREANLPGQNLTPSGQHHPQLHRRDEPDVTPPGAGDCGRTRGPHRQFILHTDPSCLDI